MQRTLTPRPRKRVRHKSDEAKRSSSQHRSDQMLDSVLEMEVQAEVTRLAKETDEGTRQLARAHDEARIQQQQKLDARNKALRVQRASECAAEAQAKATRVQRRRIKLDHYPSIPDAIKSAHVQLFQLNLWLDN